MIGYTISRLLQAIPILILVSLMAFGIIYLIPGDAATVIGGPSATAEDLAQIRANLGLDQPLYMQIVTFYTNLFQGDLGRSLMLGIPVTEAIIQRSPITIGVAIYSLVITIVLGLVTGIIAALNHNRWIDQAATIFALIGVSLPNFWLALVLIVLFSVQLGWLPTGGYIPFTTDPWGWLRTTTLPALSLALLQAGLLTRITRSTMLEVLSQDYIRTARAKGLSEWVVVGKHALANVMMPVVTVLGLILSVLLSGSIVIESIFGVPGIGALLGNAISSRDYPMIQGGLLFVTAALLLLNIVVDVLYTWLDPRIRVGGGK
ncbi:peptide/nickel transport system permease protein [Devosia enhydra]|uniref:Peptide/nickel transport system permease protein n=1 Tax=Devosia enhydra TaxID=665118 RepID=A0A1K2HWG6_9HYPH|nr:ABC transporter permease [Devosia enhydra]SFZ83339.1 peptide/nickel transport system permease protein [Devosia enhydra]